MTDFEKNMPVDTKRVGDVEVPIWMKLGEYGPMFSYKLNRSYKDEEDNERKNTPYLGMSDVDDAIYALQQVKEYMMVQKKEYKFMKMEAEQRKQESKQPSTSATSRSKSKSNSAEPKPETK